MKQKDYKGMKRQVFEETVYGIGFFHGIESKLPLYALTAATKEIVAQGLIAADTSDEDANNILITEAIKQLGYQDFKEVAPYLFSYPREQREKGLLVSPITVSRDYFEELKAKADELFYLKQAREDNQREKVEQMERGIVELETDQVLNGDRVIGVNVENETLLLLRQPETAYIDDWEIMTPGLITDYRDQEESDYQTITFLMKHYSDLKVIFFEEVLNRDRSDGYVVVDKAAIEELPSDTIPDFKTHRAFYDYASQYASFRKEFGSYEDYVLETYERDYPTDYGLKFFSDGIPQKRLSEINQELRKDQKELVLYTAYGYTDGEEYKLAYLRDVTKESISDINYYLRHRVGAFYRGSLTEVAIIPIDSIDPVQGYRGVVEEAFLIDSVKLGIEPKLDLKKVIAAIPELKDFVAVDVAKEMLLPKESEKQTEKEEDLEL
ncbi:hypothetical protein [Streptococcus ovis]|uniref:hypothetical protein n=1 Tax=Streptococcus ovis TaxID=82806 RepID=UPI00037B85EA|nr:hypothetical protein [Streptococcus ovis]